MNRPIWSNLIQTLILAAVIGGTAGILTSALTNNYLSDYSLQLAELTKPLRLSEERPRNFPQSFAEAVSEVKAKAQPGVVEFYLNKTGRVSFDAVGEPIAYGLVLTSDGWLVAYPPAKQSIGSTHIVIQKDSYPAQKIVNDPVSGAVFIKIDAQNLPVVAFGHGFDVQTGEQVFLLPGSDSLLSARVSRLAYGPDLIQESDRPERRLVLDHLPGRTLSGAPAANLAGEFIGLAATDAVWGTVIIPNEIILPAFTSLLRAGEIKRASLGVKYVDLSQAAGLSPDLARQHESGALLWNNLYAPVPYHSAAAAGGLKVNDIILSIDGRPLNSQRSLSEYLLDYQPGDIVHLSIDRDEQTLKLPVTLQAR